MVNHLIVFKVCEIKSYFYSCENYSNILHFKVLDLTLFMFKYLIFEHILIKKKKKNEVSELI